MLADWPSLLFNALGWGMATFLVAAGLTLVFGILHVLNFSHGGFFMIGAYLAFTISAAVGSTNLVAFLGASLAAALVVGLLGLMVDRAVFRRLAQVDGAYVLVATYALLLVCNGAVKLIWGLTVQSAQPPAALFGVTILGDLVMPHYAVFVIAAGIAVYLALEWLLNLTAAGKLIRAIAADPWMAQLLGVNVGLVYSATVALGFALAGLAGGFLVANQSLSPDLAGIFIIQAFGVVIIGGMGSIRGAFLASLLLGLVDSFGTALLPDMPGILFFVALAVLLLVRPQGLLGSGRLA
jgi:branched-chain amino acid transport system permease protein